LRVRVVAAHEAGEGSYATVAQRFGVGEASVKRWCWRYRSHGTVEPRPRGGGVHSQITADELEAILQRLGDANAGELTAEFNRQRRGGNRVHVSSMKRALYRNGYVVKKKRFRPLEQLRPDVQAKRRAFLRKVRRIPRRRLVFLDESGLHRSMARSHVWVKKGTEYIERTPMNWGTNLTLLGAIRLTGWVLLSSMFKTANAERFVHWLKTKLLPKLRRGDVLIMDNLKAHHDDRVRPLCRVAGVRLIYLPPYSPDFNPIEPGWALQKQHVRKHAPRDRFALRRIARRARYRITPQHCRRWFEHAGYSVQPK